jgi:NAD(P)H-dependent FMN reductase
MIAPRPHCTVLILVGSLRRASVNRQLAQIAMRSAPEGVATRLFERLGALPFYNEDLDNDPAPEAVVALRAEASSADALLLVTPEYNGGIPAVIKNAIDWLSRPYCNSPLKDKPAAVIGASLSEYGGQWAHGDTRRSLGIAGPRVIESIALSMSIKSLGEVSSSNCGLADRLGNVLRQLAVEVSR